MAWGYYYIGAMHRYFSNVYAMKLEHEKAIDYFTRATELDPNFARAYLDRGILYWREIDHPRKAIQDLTLALTLNPQLSEAQFNRAIAHQQLREYDRAITEFQAYLETGTHPHWRKYAENMIRELSEWTPDNETIP
jgi:tetratricopeptide (TPR) repeat protein